MDFLTLVKIVLRRWRLVLPVLALSGFLTLRFVASVPPVYRADGSVLLASPGGRVDGTAPQVNPFTNLDYAASVVSKIVADLMQDRAVVERLAQSGADPDYMITTSDSTPVILIESTTESERLSIDTVRIVIKGIETELMQRQKDAGGPPETWVRALVLSSPTEADRLIAGKVKALLALTAVSLTAVVSLALLVESAGDGRRRRRATRLDPAPVPLELLPPETRTEGFRPRGEEEQHTEGAGETRRRPDARLDPARVPLEVRSPEDRAEGFRPRGQEEQHTGSAAETWRRPDPRPEPAPVPLELLPPERRAEGFRSRVREEKYTEGTGDGGGPDARQEPASVTLEVLPSEGRTEGFRHLDQEEQQTGTEGRRVRLPHPAAGVREVK